MSYHHTSPQMNEQLWEDFYLYILLEMLPPGSDPAKLRLFQDFYFSFTEKTIDTAVIEILLLLREQLAPLHFSDLSARLDLRSKELLAQATLLLATVHGSLSQTELASWRGLCQKLGLLPEHTQEILSAFLHTVHLPAPVSSQHFCLN